MASCRRYSNLNRRHKAAFGPDTYFSLKQEKTEWHKARDGLTLEFMILKSRAEWSHEEMKEDKIEKWK